MIKKTITTILFSLLTLLASPLPPAGNGGWMPSFTTNIGITFSNPPRAGQGFSRVNGVVSNPEVLAQLGLEGIAKNSRAFVTPFYLAGFTVKEGGKTFNPSIIKITVGSQYVVVSPQKGSNTLKALATGDKNAKPPSGGNGWIPSWSTNIGITFSNPPGGGQAFNKVNGVVSQPEVLQKKGFQQVKAGDKISLAQEDSLKFGSQTKALARISTAGFYEVFVVENNGKLVPVGKVW